MRFAHYSRTHRGSKVKTDGSFDFLSSPRLPANFLIRINNGQPFAVPVDYLADL
jgi:hypothetical protein